MLCLACKSSDAAYGKDWVPSDVGCHECAMNSSEATTLVGAIMFGCLLFGLGAALGWWRFTRPSIEEQRFVNAFRRINELGAERIVKEFFGKPIGSGITKEDFVATVVEKCGNGVDSTVSADKLWDKLDEDGDGQVDLDEFISFVCDLRAGKVTGGGEQSKYTKALLSFIGSAKEWWGSMKSQTLRTVIIAHFQLISSIPASFPEMDPKVQATATVNGADQAVITGAAGVVAASNSTAGADEPVTFFKKAVTEVTGTVANINVSVLDFIGCFLGPRHEHRLIYTTVTAVSLLVVASLVPWLIRCCVRGRDLAQHDSNLIATFQHACSKGQLVLIFLVYPAITQTVMRTFVCKEYAVDDDGNPTSWLVDDTVVQCDLGLPSNPADPSTAYSYAFLYYYSCFMIVVVVAGFPAFLLSRLWSWRRPFDRMYFVDEDGVEKPTEEALGALGAIVMFHSGAWYFSIVDMFFKFMLVSFVVSVLEME